MENNIFLLRLGIAFILSLIFGLERQKSHKPVGFGTFIFVTVGSCSLSIIALGFGAEDNPLPLLGAIVTGIGFLGAGALIKTTDKIFGFTTAASIWVFAIFGLAIGIGDYTLGLVLYSLVWISILIDKHLEKRGIGSYQRKITIKLKGVNHFEKIEKLISDQQINKHRMISKKVNKKDNFTELSYILDGTEKELKRLLGIIEKNPDFIEGMIE